MKFVQVKWLLLPAVAALVACGGGGGGGGGTTPTSMTVTPSLGQFSAGTQVKLQKPDATQLATGAIGTDGRATLTFSGYTGPVVVVVLGGASVTYYDEKLVTGTTKGSMQPFDAGKTLRAVMAAPQPYVGVTALTNAAVVKLEAVSGGIAGASAGTINIANNKVAAAFGLPDILLAPTPVSAATGATLSIAKLEDNYALILASLAKTAATGKTATDVAAALAIDMKDDKLDGLDGLSATTPTAPIANAPTPTTIAAQYQAAVAELVLPAEQFVASSLPLVINVDVTSIKVAPNQSDVTLAKAMFGELRTTLNSFSNGNHTGFLNTQAARMNLDLSANVVPNMERVARRISALGATMNTFEDAKAYSSTSPFGFLPDNVRTPSGSTVNVLARRNGTLAAVWSGYGGWNLCWRDVATVSIIDKVTCAFAGSDNAVRISPTSGFIRMMVFEATGTGPYTYTAKRVNLPVTVTTTNTTNGPVTTVTPGTPTLVTEDSLGNLMPIGEGTVAKTFSGSTITGLTLSGTLPPSASSATNTLVTGVDTVAISIVRNALASPANSYRYALSGSVSTSKLVSGTVDPTKVVTLSLDSGSYIDLTESATDEQVVAVKMIGTAQTLATRFTGTIEASSFARSKDTVAEIAPTSVVFNGSISDIRLAAEGGVGQILTGKLEAAVTDYVNFYAIPAETSGNFLKATLTFTGTVQAPERPLMKLVLGAARTGLKTGAVTLSYSYGAITITGSGMVDSATPANNTLTLSNQDGIQVLITSNAQQTVTKSGATVATISNGSIRYADGVTESLN